MASPLHQGSKPETEYRAMARLAPKDRVNPTTAHLPGPESNWMFWPAARLRADSAWTGHIPFAHWIVSALRPKVLVELGTHSGASYSAFCEAVIRSESPTTCYAVDTWRGDEHTGKYAEDIYRDLSAFNLVRYGSFSTLLRKTFDAALGDITDGTVDLLHIDGLHTYEAVKHDFDTWLPKLSNSAVVLFHDTQERRADFGVWRFWAELRQSRAGFEFTHSHGLGVLKVGRNVPKPISDFLALSDVAQVQNLQRRFEYLGARLQIEANSLMMQAEGRRLVETVNRLEAENRRLTTALAARQTQS